MLTNVANAAGREGLRKLRAVATAQMNAGIRSAFSGQRDPMTGRAWAPRKADPGWPPLWRTGTLMQNLYGETEVKSKRLFISGSVHQRGSGAGSLHAQAGALFYGRKDGSMPPRPFAGITRSGSETIASSFARIIERAR